MRIGLLSTLVRGICFASITVNTACSVDATAEKKPAPAAKPVTPAATVPATSAVPSGGGKLEPAACRFILPRSLEGNAFRCVDLIVPENRAKRDNGKTIKLHAVIFAGKNKGTPTIELNGGPGGQSNEQVMGLATNDPTYLTVYGSFLDKGDLVFFDQRGVGVSEPALTCFPEEKAAVAAKSAPSQVETVAKCRERHVAAGVDLSAYVTSESADDVEDLRLALGYAEVDLHSISYGTLLAQETIRRHPSGIRTAIIDGVVPPDAYLIGDTQPMFDAALTRVFAACKKDATCNGAYPDIEGELARAHAKLSAAPLTVDVEGVPPFGWPELVDQLYESMYHVDGVATVPFLIRHFGTISQTDYAAEVKAMIEQAPAAQAAIRAERAKNPLMKEVDEQMDAMTDEQLTVYGLMPVAMYFSVTCSDAGQYEDVAKTNALLGKIRPHLREVDRSASLYEICSKWPTAPKRPEIREPLSSAKPILVMAGELDHATPPEWAERSRAKLTRSQYVLMPNLAHGSIEACGGSIKTAFYADPSKPVDTSCTSSLQISFVVPPPPGASKDSATDAPPAAFPRIPLSKRPGLVTVRRH